MPDGLAAVAPLLCAATGLFITSLAGTIRYRLAPGLGVLTAALTFAVALWARGAADRPLDVAWAPTLNLRLSFSYDGLAALYSILASGIGLAVLVYSWRYMALHLAHEQQPPATGTRFYGFMLLFMASMIGLVAAHDLILMFVFWDLTAIASYFLIGFDRARLDARVSALMAMLVTGISSVLFLIGSIMLYVRYSTFSLPELSRQITPGWYTALAAGLMVVAALAKSAQVPAHFWLPRAMVAPTPVSAYLHSAAMVAAGVFLISRIYPLITPNPRLLDLLLVIGFMSMLTGGLLALVSEVLKRILAYSTIAQYGYVVAMLGIGGSTGAAAASFYVVAHALGKSALFLTAGAVTETTGRNRLTELGGLRRSMPLLAVASGLAAASLAALPLTLGFFKDELFFKAALERGSVVTALAVAGAAVTFAYMWRFWHGLFLGPRKIECGPGSSWLVWPVAVLSALSLAGGIIPGPATHLARSAGEASVLGPVSLAAAYHLDARTVNLLALATYALGILAIKTRQLWSNRADRVSHLGDRFGPERRYELGLAWINRMSARTLDFEVRDLRRRISTILVPAALLAIAGLLVSPDTSAFRVGQIGSNDLVLILLLALASIAAVATTFPVRHLAILLALSSVGFTLAAIYASLGAPDVALVAVLVEMLLSLIFLGVLTLFPKGTLDRQAASISQQTRRWRDVMVGIFAGLFAFLIAWGALSRPAPGGVISREHVRLTPDAHAKDVVTAILADFRGLDTAGEVTVIAIALIGVIILLREERRA